METKDLEYWKNNCEEDYLTTPISVLRYISELEQALALLSVVRSLPTKEEIASELENHQNKWSKSHDNKTNDTYALGFRHCFHFISDWINFRR